MIYESLKQIENRIEVEEYTAGGVTFYMTVDKLDFDISDDAAVNDYFVSRCAISYDEIIEIISHCDGWLTIND